jgi:outer membrane protein OmpA-like peptidoglycan-associated protein
VLSSESFEDAVFRMVFNEAKVKFNKEEQKMKKIMVLAGCMAMTFAMSTMSFGIELSSQAASTLKGSLTSGVYVSEVKGDKVTYAEASTAYRPTEWDTILKAYGLILDESKGSGLPNGYATIKGSKVDFSAAATAFSPNDYHGIFTAYGLQLDSSCIQGTISKFPYALKVASDGKVTLGNNATAFRGTEYAAILACYYLPVKAVKVEKAAETGHTAWVIASDYLFDFDKSVIKKKYYSKLDEIAVIIKKDSKLKVEVQGHTDSVGTEKYNMGLSLRRANAVRDYLIKKGGIAADRLAVVGFGESRPVAPNTTKEGRAQNRRVELQPLK